MKKLCVLLFVILLLPGLASACSMYKITKNGKTIVGNNEDWISPNSLFWFEKGEGEQFDVLYMGQLDRFAQGAMNSAGLVFDGFAMDYLEVKNVKGKISIPFGEAVQQVMRTMSDVNEVRDYLSTINLSLLETGQIVFVDRSGTYLIVEGDEMIIGSEPEQCFSNFYYSQIESTDEVELENFKNGMEFLKETRGAPSLDYVGSVMESLKSTGDMTQYTTVYDLQELTVRVYLFHDFGNYQEFSLAEKIKEGNHSATIADLFPNDSPGVENYNNYNSSDDPTKFVRDLMGDQTFSEEELESQGFSWIVNTMGYERLLYLEDPKGAIEIFKFGIELMPNNANLHDSLGEAYLENNQLKESRQSYEKSLELNPDNNGAKEALKKIKSASNGS